MREHLRRIATAGNAVALGLLVMVLANQEVLLGPERPPALFSEAWRFPERPEAPRLARRVLLVVIDGLRSKGVRSGDMPHLTQAFEWVGTNVHGLSWIPSTVAGIRTIVEGRVPPPASFLQDFGASHSRDGGMFAVLQRAGLRAYAAGPRLWADLYGPWLAGSFTVKTVGNRDEAVLRAGLKALDGGDYDLVVVHLSGPDDAAHLYGGDSREYRQALRRADGAVGRLLERAGPDTAVLVTADHQVTDRGGHAGPEVADVPALNRGPGMLPLESAYQMDLPFFLLRPLGLRMERPPHDDPPDPLQALALAAAILICGWALLRRLPGLGTAIPPTLLNGALWVCMALAVAGWGQVSLLLGLAALATTALVSREGHPALGWWSAAACGTGAAFGLLRLADAGLSWFFFPATLPPPRTALLFAVVVLACFLGWVLSRSGLVERRPLAVGLLCGILPAVLGRLLGETASLSTLDVRLAFRLADGPLGLPGAVLAVIVTQALPTLAVLFGLAQALIRSRPSGFGGFAAGLGFTVLGQALTATLGIVYGSEIDGPLALGLLVRLIGETTFLFLGSAAVLVLGGLRPRGTRSRTPAATPP